MALRFGADAPSAPTKSIAYVTRTRMKCRRSVRGRAPRGVRVIGAVPLGRWETITFVAALRHNKMVAPMVVEGAMTGEMFLAYVENCLVPTLRRNDIVVMDNCRVHLGPALAGLSKQWARHCVTCRNIRPTSIPSRCLKSLSGNIILDCIAFAA